MPDLDILDIVAMLKYHIRNASSQKALAKKIGITPQYLNNVVNFRQTPGPKILEYLGLDKIVVYRDKDDQG